MPSGPAPATLFLRVLADRGGCEKVAVGIVTLKFSAALTVNMTGNNKDSNKLAAQILFTISH